MRPDLGMEMFRNFLEAAHHKKRRGVFREPENKALGDFDTAVRCARRTEVGEMTMIGRSWCARPIAAFTAVVFLCRGSVTLTQELRQTDDYTASIQQICRYYATTQRGMPADLMFTQCMSERHCRLSPGSAGYQCEMPGAMSWHGGGY
jgi:hypothetical protein